MFQLEQGSNLSKVSERKMTVFKLSQNLSSKPVQKRRQQLEGGNNLRVELIKGILKTPIDDVLGTLPICRNSSGPLPIIGEV